MYHHVVETLHCDNQNGEEYFSQVVKNTKPRTVIKPHWRSKLNFLKGNKSKADSEVALQQMYICQSQAWENSAAVITVSMDEA